LFFGNKTLSVHACLALLAMLTLTLGLHDARAADPMPAEEATTARFQSTYIWQHKPGFNAPYSDTYSLVGQREQSYTFTATAYLGFRPWKGGELYLNPELTQGVAFSNLSGLGGFTNCEVTRVSGPNPKIYRQRLFLRQTWNHGGGTEKIESDLNQMAGFVDKNRFVLTVGNFSTLDVFDRNAYSNNPRTQFMNWAHMNNVAFDYAADARGYSWGFAGEWYQGDWTLRFGRATGPRKPNQLPMDLRLLQHYGDQVELEHEHELAGRPGSVRVLAWRNRAILASFRDAIDYGNSVNWAPDAITGHQYIINVRHGEKIKYGVGINMDQAITGSLGAFFKAMWSDGRTETLAFTEVDQSVAAGIALKGTAWGRAQDTLGLSLVRNAISRDRRQYLELGGLSYFIGDGALRYRPEMLFEGYYSWALLKGLWLTADYQRIHNPAYNADRGPVDFYTLRVHAEF
jgi:hypothetical protein